MVSDTLMPCTSTHSVIELKSELFCISYSQVPFTLFLYRYSVPSGNARKIYGRSLSSGQQLNYHGEASRLETFRDWTRRHSARVDLLAAAGFRYNSMFHTIQQDIVTSEPVKSS